MISALEKEISGSTTEAVGNLHVEGKELRRRCQVKLHFSQSGVSVYLTKWSCETKTPLAIGLQNLDTNPRIGRTHVLWITIRNSPLHFSHNSTISLPLSRICKWELGNLSQDRPIPLALCNGATRILCQMAALTQVEHCSSSHWSVSAHHMFRERASLLFQTAYSHANNTIGTVIEWVWRMEGAVDVSQYYCNMLQLHHGGGSGCVAILLWYVATASWRGQWMCRNTTVMCCNLPLPPKWVSDVWRCHQALRLVDSSTYVCSRTTQ